MTSRFLSVLKRHRLSALVLLLLIVGVWNVYRTLPQGVSIESTPYQLSDSAVTFLSDETYLRSDGTRVAEQRIFDEVLLMINEAEEYILVDMFLWNSFQGTTKLEHRFLADEVANALIDAKARHPDIEVTVVSDPINTVYDGQESPQFTRMREAGVRVVFTHHAFMRDSNPVYSALWRTLLQWPDRLHTAILDTPYTVRLFPNIMDAGGERVPLRSYLKLMNFKANHRKLIVADSEGSEGRQMVSLVTSANPHDGSSMHSNVALRITGGVWRDLVYSEQAVGKASDVDIPSPDEHILQDDSEGELNVRILTEYEIERRVLAMLEEAGEGSTVQLAMFYLSDREIIDALIRAGLRGADVSIILDPNKDAFGMEKNGVPNRSVAHALLRDSKGTISLRWCATHGEQCHGKMLLVSLPDRYMLTLGSANFTRRNLHDLNLETNVYVESRTQSTAFRDAQAYFNRMWSNEQGRLYTLDYDAYRDESTTRALQAWLMEVTGLSTF